MEIRDDEIVIKKKRFEILIMAEVKHNYYEKLCDELYLELNKKKRNGTLLTNTNS